MRRTRGDGNCFFRCLPTVDLICSCFTCYFLYQLIPARRAFIFAYMESLVVTNDLAERNRWARPPETSRCCWGCVCSPARLLLVWRGVRAQGRPFQVADMLLRLGRKGWAVKV